ncbi:hypothetical protein EMIT0P395_20296 [Pseudomonas sp. IT-P395]
MIVLLRAAQELYSGISVVTLRFLMVVLKQNIMQLVTIRPEPMVDLMRGKRIVGPPRLK